jgi:DNA-binding NarL/FixJ family response regulator
MPPKTRLENEESRRASRVILIGGVEAPGLSGVCPFEIHRCEDATQAARFWDGAETNILLVDLDRLSSTERDLLRKRMVQFSSVLVLAIADSLDQQTCERLLRMGCVGSLRRREAPATIVRALHAVIAGELWFPRAALSRVLRGFLVAQDPDRLTARELEIMALAGAGLNNQEIADRLFISRETVRWHIKSLNGKLGIRTRHGLRDYVRLLHRLGKAKPAQGASEGELESRVAG